MAKAAEEKKFQFSFLAYVYLNAICQGFPIYVISPPFHVANNPDKKL